MSPPDFHSPTRILFGPGRIGELGEVALSLDAKRTLVVSDPGIEEVGHTQRGVEYLRAVGIEPLIFDGLQENPTTLHVDAGLQVAKEFQPDLLIAIGGGSSMDCAKGINFLYSCGGKMQDYWGTDKATGPLLPMIAVPTTAGTGSEAQSYALISDLDTHIKMACGDKRAAFIAAILDPELTLTQPARVTALTGLDAIAHAIETYVTKPRNEISQSLSLQAWRRLTTSFPKVVQEPSRLDARAEMQLGACLAGSAIENSMLGAAHALANPLTASYEIAHGEAVALMLPQVIRRNGVAVGEEYALLLSEHTSHTTANPTESLATLVEEFRNLAGLAGKLKDCGVAKSHLPELAATASQQWTGKFNPIPFSAEEYLQLYESSY